MFIRPQKRLQRAVARQLEKTKSTDNKNLLMRRLKTRKCRQVFSEIILKKFDLSFAGKAIDFPSRKFHRIFYRKKIVRLEVSQRHSLLPTRFSMRHQCAPVTARLRSRDGSTATRLPTPARPQLPFLPPLTSPAKSPIEPLFPQAKENSKDDEAISATKLCEELAAEEC